MKNKRSHVKLAYSFLILLMLTLETAAQSTIVFESGTIIEVTAGADICADAVIIQGTYSGAGTLCDGPLPVELTLFTATLQKNAIYLFWLTETEVDNYGFNVERKIDAGEWSTISFIPGNGNSNSLKEYAYYDEDLFVGGCKFQYRLKLIDNDGSFEYSDIVEVEIIPDQFELSQNYPNPFNPVTKIRYSLPEKSDVILKIYDLLGNEIATLVSQELQAGNYTVDFNATVLSSGIYIYNLSAGNFVSNKKMILIK